MVGNPSSSKDVWQRGFELDKGRHVCYNQFSSGNYANVWIGSIILRNDMINDFWIRPIYFALGFAVCFCLFSTGVI